MDVKDKCEKEKAVTGRYIKQIGEKEIKLEGGKANW